MAGNIETYSNNVEAPRADSAGSAAFEMAGRHAEATYAQAGRDIGSAIDTVGRNVENYEEIQDTNAISKAGAQAFTDLSSSLRTTMANADPNQADQAADKWRNEVLEPALDKIGDGVNTRHGQEMTMRMQETLRSEFTKQSIGASSTLAGEASISTVNQTANGVAQAVSNDPSLLPTGIAMIQGTIADQIKAHGDFTPEQVAHLRSMSDDAVRHVSVAAFQSMAERNPQAAKDALTSGTFAGIFSGEEIGTLNRYADTQAKAKEEADKAAATQAAKQQRDDFNSAASQAYTSMLQPDGSLVVPRDLPQQIVKMGGMPGVEPGTVRSMIEMVKTINTDNAKEVKVQSDPHAYEKFSNALLDGTLTDRDIYQARAERLLSDQDVNYFRQASRDLAADPMKKEAEKQFNAFLAAQKGAFTQKTIFGTSDPRGAQNFFQFSQAAHAQFDAAYKAGNWQQVLQSNNPGYLGRLAPSYMTNKKGATPATGPNLTGTVISGYRFTGNGPDQWKDQKYWQKVGQ